MGVVIGVAFTGGPAVITPSTIPNVRMRLQSASIATSRINDSANADRLRIFDMEVYGSV